jgi:hypothetical protein
MATLPRSALASRLASLGNHATTLAQLLRDEDQVKFRADAVAPDHALEGFERLLRYVVGMMAADNPHNPEVRAEARMLGM